MAAQARRRGYRAAGTREVGQSPVSAPNRPNDVPKRSVWRRQRRFDVHDPLISIEQIQPRQEERVEAPRDYSFRVPIVPDSGGTAGYLLNARTIPGDYPALDVRMPGLEVLQDLQVSVVLSGAASGHQT